MKETQPALVVDHNKVSGKVEFIGSYNLHDDRFRVIENEALDKEGMPLRVSFEIEISKRENKTFSQLPSLRVKDIEPLQDLHFNSQIDQTACLCSSLEEEEFLTPTFQFRPFFEKLVMPFLYEQAFYAREHYWPWGEYAHGSAGLLESYASGKNTFEIEAVLKKLELDKAAWPKIKATLLQKADIKGHASCFCKKGDEAGNKIKRCHPDALKGLLRLKRDIENAKIQIQ